MNYHSLLLHLHSNLCYPTSKKSKITDCYPKALDIGIEFLWGNTRPGYPV